MNILYKTLFLLLVTTLSLFPTPPTDANNSIHVQKSSPDLKRAFKKQSRQLLKNLPQKKFLKRFYRKNNYKTVWIVGDKLNKQKSHTLFELIKNDITLEHDGSLYTKALSLEKNLDNNMTDVDLLRYEIQLTSLYNTFLQHTLYGEILWKKFSYRLAALKRSKINASWVRNKAPHKIEELLLAEDLNATIREITPKRFGYAELIAALEKLTEMKEDGGWEKLPKFKKVALGSRGNVVLKLRKRLMASGDYLPCDSNNSLKHSDSNKSVTSNIEKDALFDECLNVAVKKFQKRHGLVVDGIVGKGTQKVLNMSVDEKIKKVRLNIDRIKWLPRDEQEQYVVVNIPEFMLHYIEKGEEKKKLRVIVGDRRHHTPIFSNNISFIVLNPYWKVPKGIIEREIIPKMVKNPNYLRKQGLQIHTSWNENSPVIPPSSLYWEDYLDGNISFPYRIMQAPGARNALGKIKFKFPNRFAVYLHDTPSKRLFKRTVRAFSHGCIRLHEPKQLLETIATFNPTIDLQKAQKTLKGKHKKQINIKEKLRIYIIYLTAGVNAEGALEFRNDIYKYDKYQKRFQR